MASLLEAIADRVIGEGRPGSGTAPVELSIGYVAKTRMCLQDGIVIIEAPATVTTVVMDWIEQRNESPEGQDSGHVIRAGPAAEG